MPNNLPSLFIPRVPLNLHTLEVIAPYALAMALVGLLESLITAKLVDDLTDSHIWDASSVAALDAITTKYQRKGKTVQIVGLNDSSAARHGRLTGELPSH